jgi:CPA2 family monovalent cation:H+ antiporter-2
MQSAHFFRDLAVVMLAAGLAALLFRRLRQPKVLGYVLAGLVLGPHTPPFPLIRDEASIRLLADLGVVFLMFSVGLEFNLRRLRKAGATAGVTALLDVAVMLWLGYHLGRALGWSRIESLFLGGIICDSSTTILARGLQELGRTREKFAGIAVGITLVEDMLVVAVMTILTGVAVTGAWHADLIADRLWALVLFLTVVTVLGLLTVPRVLDFVHRLRDPEVLLLVLLGIGCTVTLIADRLQLSLALGAVLVGALASESRAANRIAGLMDPLRHMFGAVFFVAIGLMLDPAMLLQHAGPIVLVTALIVAGKFLNTALGTLLTGHDMPLAIRVGASLAQVGEFAFIVAALGVTLGITRHPVYQVGVAAAILSIVVNPPLTMLAERLAATVEKNPGCQRWTAIFHLYGQWAERIGRRRKTDAVGRAVRRNVWVMVVCVVLIALAIASAGYLAHKAPGVLRALPAQPWLPAVLLWLGAMVVCLPFYATFLSKLQGLGMLLAEIAIPAGHPAPWARPARTFIAHAILAAGAIALAILTFLLSSAFFHSREVLLLLMAGAGIAGFFGWRKVARAYRQARESLEGMIGVGTPRKGAATGAPHEEAVHDTMLDLEIAGTTIPPGSSAVGRELRALLLRTRTGATVIGIERAGHRLVNPAPSERLQAGDRVLLLGEPEQIQRARSLLAQAAAS